MSTEPSRAKDITAAVETPGLVHGEPAEALKMCFFMERL